MIQPDGRGEVQQQCSSEHGVVPHVKIMAEEASSLLG